MTLFPTTQTPMHPLTQARRERGISRAFLAAFTGLSEKTISRIEQGQPSRLDVHHRLREYFGKTSRELGLRYVASEVRRQAGRC